MWLILFLTINGQNLMDKMIKDLGNFNDRIMEITMTIKEGSKKTIKKVKIWEKDKQKMIKFTYPRDMRGIGILILKKGEIYLWMPSYRSVKRITSSTLYSNFMGTDFSYAELTGAFYKKFKLSKTEEKKNCYILTLKAIKQNVPYKYLKIFLDKNNQEPDSIKFYVNRPKKIIRIKDKKKIDGCLIPITMVVESLDNHHKTVIYIEDVELNKGLKSNFFTKLNLRRAK